MSEIDLSECPFCGNDACMVAPISTFMTSRVICPVCDCGGPECFGVAEAAEAWNRRIPHDRLMERIASAVTSSIGVVVVPDCPSCSSRYTVTDAGRAMLKDGE